MRSGAISYEQFCEEAKLLAERSHQAAREKSNGEAAEVATWEWRHGNRQHLDGDSYLVSTGNVRKYNRDLDDTNTEGNAGDDGDINELLQVAEDTWSVTDEEAESTLNEMQLDETALFEFHIVYHTIYQTPVLYFRASAVDGTPLPTELVTRGVEFPGANGRPTFAAMEEHPVLGKPFSFLHPCETAAAMQLLQDQVKNASSSEAPRYLASWLSLVQPLTRISPVDYYAIR